MISHIFSLRMFVACLQISEADSPAYKKALSRTADRVGYADTRCPCVSGTITGHSAQLCHGYKFCWLLVVNSINSGELIFYLEPPSQNNRSNATSDLKNSKVWAQFSI
jgi:hypothetical protein